MSVLADGGAFPSAVGNGSRLVSTRSRATLALVLAILTGAFAAARAIHEPHWPTDFDQFWFAARALLRGVNPYTVVGPGREFQWDWPLYYPLPGVLFAVPLTVLPVAVGRVLFSAIAGGVLGWAMGARVRYLWPLLLSASYLIATSRTQWSAFLLAIMWLPAVGAFATAKPNVGFMTLVTLSRRDLLTALVSCSAIGLLSLLIRPGWIGEWQVALGAPHVLAPPVTRFGGFLLLLAALKWRRPEARLLLAVACVPHTPSLYDVLLLFFACHTLRESLGFAILTHALFWGWISFGSAASFDAYALGLGQAAVYVIYLPVLAMILRRPNEFPASRPIAEPSGFQWRELLPSTRVDLTLLGVLAVASAMLIWLPLVTYRS
jgi:hypothetical protein